jgi:hypothetical protein
MMSHKSTHLLMQQTIVMQCDLKKNHRLLAKSTQKRNLLKATQIF